MGPGKSRRTVWRKQTGPEMIRLSLEMYYVGSPGCMRRGKCIKNINIGGGGGGRLERPLSEVLVVRA